MKTNERNILILIFVLITSLFPLSGIISQQGSDSILQDRNRAIKYAYRNLNGVGIKLNYGRAYNIFKLFAENGDGEAYNALGMMYKHGLGVKQNDKKALALFLTAAEKGYAKGAYNAGLAFKYGHGVEQNPEKSTELIDLSAKMGFDKTDYAVGYSYYKGQGRTQDYQKAVECFKKGAEDDDASCMFNLGHCYFKGRGVERDAEKGKYWIEKAANKGLNRAVDFITREDSKTYGKPKIRIRSAANDGFSDLIPQTRQAVENPVGNKNNIEGEWQGKLITYDWSGKEIEDESTLKVVFEVEDDALIGFWIEDESNPVRISATEEDAVWKFDNIQLNENKRPLQMKVGSFNFETKDNADYLLGNISFYSETTKEYTRPNYIVLKKVENTNSITESTIHGTGISPNPFQDVLNIRFTLKHDDNVSINIFDMSGRNLHKENRQAYGQGENSLIVNTSSFSKGSYVLQIVGESINYSTIIIK